MNTSPLVNLHAPQPDPQACDLPRVLLVVDQFPRTLGGGERIALKLAALLPRYGYHASILTFFVHPESHVAATAPCPLYLLPLRRTYDLTALRSAFALRNFIENQRVQIVQTFFESSDLWAGMVTKAMTDAKLIWSRRDLGILRSRKHRIAYRLMANVPDAVFAVSEQVREHCIQVDGIEPARVYTAHNGLDLSRWPDPALRTGHADEFQIASVGNIRRVKGYDVLVRAAAVVVQQHPRVRFNIAGGVLEEDCFLRLQDLIRELGLAEHFHFAGNVTDLQPFLATADAFVLPSRSEGFSNALVEAMAAGLPIIATDVGGNSEAIDSASNGILVPSEDVLALAHAVIQLISDPARSTELGRAARRTAMDRFTDDAMMKKTTKVYDRVLGRPAHS